MKLFARVLILTLVAAGLAPAIVDVSPLYAAKHVIRAGGVKVVTKGHRRALRSTQTTVQRGVSGTWVSGPAYTDSCGN